MAFALSMTSQAEIKRLCFKQLGMRKTAVRHQALARSREAATVDGRLIAFYNCAQAPVSDDADYAPTGLGDLCLDTTTNDVYRCSAYTNGTTFTWTKIREA